MLEIGPGIGVLTAPLSRQCESVLAVELDARMLGPLKRSAPSAEIVCADVLKTDLLALLQRLPEPRSLVSNMPYNITGPLLGKVAECRPLFRNAVLMMQKEVGERVLASAGSSERGSLSVVMQLQFKITKVCDANAHLFEPPPKVDSIVLEFTPLSSVPALESTLKAVKAGFVQPRKTLFNNLAKAFTKEAARGAIEAEGLPHNVRPHQVTNEQWIALASRL